jgi:hypothetical protein
VSGTSDAFVATVMLEATNVSEGRGTTRPFNVIGAPWMNGNAFISFFTSIQQQFTNSSYANLNGILSFVSLCTVGCYMKAMYMTAWLW